MNLLERLQIHADYYGEDVCKDAIIEIERLRAALLKIIDRAEFRMGSAVSDEVVKIAREALL